MIEALFYAYWILMPFYFRDSGNMQISHSILALAFVLFFAIRASKNINLFSKIDIKLVFFVVFVFAINSLYFLLFRQDPFFLRSSMFYLFNLLLVVLFRELVSKKKNFTKNLFFLCRFNLIVQTAIYFWGRETILGMNIWWGGRVGLRYIGTLNDPNQFGLFILFTFMIMNVISVSNKYNVKLKIIDYAMVTFLVFQSASFGMFLGTSTLMATALFFQVPKRKLPLIFGSIAIGAVVTIFVFNINVYESFMLERIEQRFEDSTLYETFISFFEDRALDRIYLYPQYFIFGSGEGAHDRFFYRPAEMHSTILSLAFYYGIIPFVILLSWVRDNIRGLNIKELPIILSMFAASFTILAQRQPFIWLILVLICSNRNEQVSTIWEVNNEVNDSDKLLSQGSVQRI